MDTVYYVWIVSLYIDTTANYVDIINIVSIETITLYITTF